MRAKVELRLCGEMDHLRIAWQVGETLLEPIPFRDDADGTRYNVLLAVQEMVTNVLRHAYEGSEKEPVWVAFEADDSGMTVVIKDQGPEFDPLEIKAPEESAEMLVTPGGFGIMIARVVMDELEYAREDDWNVLRMFKSVQPCAAALPRG